MTKRSSKKTQARRSSLKTFIKTVNYNHMMPTRYQLDLDLKGVVSGESLESAAKKVEARKEAKKLLEEKFQVGARGWAVGGGGQRPPQGRRSRLGLGGSGRAKGRRPRKGGGRGVGAAAGKCPRALRANAWRPTPSSFLP